MSTERSRYHFAGDFHAAGLRDELLAAGVDVSLVNPAGDGVDIDIPAAQYDQAVAVVAAHVAQPYRDAEAAIAAENAEDVAAVRGKYDIMQARAQQFRDDAENMPPAPLTAQQIRQRLVAIENGLADLADAVAHIGRRLEKFLP